MPMISHWVNSLPNNNHASTAAEIGSMDESIDPVTAPTRRTPSKYALKETTVPKMIILQTHHRSTNPTQSLQNSVVWQSTQKPHR